MHLLSLAPLSLTWVTSLPAGQVRYKNSAISRLLTTYLLLDGILKSTVHRAINRSGIRRYSIPLFFGTDYDVKVEVFFPFYFLPSIPG